MHEQVVMLHWVCSLWLSAILLTLLHCSCELMPYSCHNPSSSAVAEPCSVHLFVRPFMRSDPYRLGLLALHGCACSTGSCAGRQGKNCLQVVVHPDFCFDAMQCCTAYIDTERGGGTFARPYASSNQNLFLSPTGKHTSGVNAA